MTDEVVVAHGLEGIVAGESTICRVDGAKGVLYYRGYSIEDLAAHSTFAETTYLLLYGQRIVNSTEPDLQIPHTRIALYYSILVLTTLPGATT